ncbi:MAG: hypothetical protein H0T49_10360 [Chloroflexia bacterium]|nr:hypothetical protein [Chloroflexia bacterium]
MTIYSAPAIHSRLRRAPSFRHWQRESHDSGGLPLIAVAGSRGKSSVVRMLDAIFSSANLRTATWTDLGVEIFGRRQRGELAPWSRALSRLASGTLDVAIQELDWSTVNAVGLPHGVYPIVAVTNLCLNSDSCLNHADSRLGLAAFPRITHAVRSDGILVLNGEDFSLAGAEADHPSPTILVAINSENPLIRSHLEHGGSAAWLHEDALYFGDHGAQVQIIDTEGLSYAMGGAASFQIINVLTAASVAVACGMDIHSVSNALAKYSPSISLLPRSFHVSRVFGATAVVDRAGPSWFLRPMLRAVNPGMKRTQVTVLSAAMDIPDIELQEVGRLLGRTHGAIILHSESLEPERSALLRRGIRQNDVPPLVVHTPTERQAVGRALRLIRPHHVLMVLADDPAAVHRTLSRAGQQAWVSDKLWDMLQMPTTGNPTSPSPCAP